MFIGLLPHCVESFEQLPTLECFADGLRLHFRPEKPFHGHIYVKGFFMSNRCHLDYTKNPLYNPFFFHVPYRSGCNVKREKQNNPLGVNYHVVIIVQHHYLFLTKIDKAYSVNCFYREFFDNIVQDMEVSGLTPTELTNENAIPDCVYDVIKNSVNGKPVKYAIIGEELIHKWSCNSDDYGMLIHSCVVRDPDGVTFQLINDQGCITDHTLIAPLNYSENLTMAYSLVPAFKFADQPFVRFQCKITLCFKEDNGCEGITPPSCKIESNTSIDSYVPVPDNFPEVVEEPTVENEGINGSDSALTVRPYQEQRPTNSKQPIGNELENDYLSMQNTELSGYSNAVNNSDNSVNSRSESYGDQSLLTPKEDYVGYRRVRSATKSTIEADSRSRKYRLMTNLTNLPANNTNRFTLDVNAEQLIIFGRGETEEKASTEAQCQTSRNAILFQTGFFSFLSLLMISIIFAQKRIYDKRLLKSISMPIYEMQAERWQI